MADEFEGALEELREALEGAPDGLSPVEAVRTLTRGGRRSAEASLAVSYLASHGPLRVTRKNRLYLRSAENSPA